MISIPPDRLPPETLNAIVEEFVAREATDYGDTEIGFEIKVSQVKKQIDVGDVVICFDPTTESCTLLTKHQFSKVIAENGL